MKMIEKSINYAIKTIFEKNRPRLLLLSVDVNDCSTAVTFDSYINYNSVCDVCSQDLRQNKLLAKHVIGHIKEISNPAQGIDGEIISKSIPSADRNENPSNNSEDHIWTSIYGDGDNDVRKHVVSYNGIDNDILMASSLFPYPIITPVFMIWYQGSNERFGMERF